MPSRFHYRHRVHHRVPPVFGLVDQGWKVISEQLHCSDFPGHGYHGMSGTYSCVCVCGDGDGDVDGDGDGDGDGDDEGWSWLSR